MQVEPVSRWVRYGFRASVAAALVVVSAWPVPAQAASERARTPAGTALVSDPASLVNPFIGTKGGGNESPGAQAPFGMVTWGPDTPGGGDGSGYKYGATTINGFSLTHLSGVGCRAAGEIPLLPTVGTPASGATETMGSGSQHASPGFYQVTGTDGITTELTATQRTGLAQITFPSGSQDSLVLKLSGDSSGGLAVPSKVTYQEDSATEIQGSVTSGDFCRSGNSYTVYFDMQFSAPLTKSTSYVGRVLTPDATRLSVHGRPRPGSAPRPVSPNTPEPVNHPVFHGTAPVSPPAITTPTGVDLSFASLSAPLLVRVGLSYVSEAGAHANLDQEQAITAPGTGDSFSAVQGATVAAWNGLLGRIQVSAASAAGNSDEQTVFYTALYHALCYPTVFSDDNGEYLGMDGKVHTVPSGHAFYTNFSGWDIYRTQVQLLAMLAPHVAGDVATSMLDDYAQAGELPKWVEYNTETHVMVGDPADAILADLYAFGARMNSATLQQALADMVEEATYATPNRPGLNYLTSPGYLPKNGIYCRSCNYYAPVTATLEYGTDDFAISAVAAALGDTSVQQAFLSRAQDWQNLINPGSGFLQARTVNGAWLAAGAPPTQGKGMAEADSWQYTGMVPFNVAGLAAYKGGDAAMAGYLDHVLSGFLGGRNSSHAGMGNEPSFELPWEYDYVGEPYQTQAKVRDIQDQIWTDTPTSLPGNDDLGTMSAWFVWSALGMYPMTPGTADLALGSPLFTSAVITLPAGGTLTIDATGGTGPAVADGTTGGTPYVQSASWTPASGSAQAWDAAYAPPGSVSSGGTLTFALGASPDTSWAATAPPPSYPAPGKATQTGTIVSAVGTDLCMDDSGSRTSNGNKIDVYGCNGSGAQLWTMGTDRTVRVLGKCLQPVKHSRANHIGAVLSSCRRTRWQRWKTGPGHTLVNVASRKCLGDPRHSRSNGTQLQLWTCWHGDDQRWQLPYSSPPPPAGHVMSVQSRKCADDANGRTSNGNVVVIYSCKNTGAQRWVIEPDGTIHSSLADGCLDVHHSGTAPGTRVDYYPCNNTGAQQWRKGTHRSLVNPESGLCLEAPRSSNGARLRLEACTGARNQRWKLP